MTIAIMEAEVQVRCKLHRTALTLRKACIQEGYEVLYGNTPTDSWPASATQKMDKFAGRSCRLACNFAYTAKLNHFEHVLKC